MGETVSLAASAIGHLFRGGLNVGLAVNQMAAIGVDSIPIVAATAASTGAVFAFYTAGVFLHFGAGPFAGGILTVTFFLELGPVLAGISVAARSGAAIAAEIGSMVVTEQVDALRALGVAPARYLVLPRMVACVLMMPIAGLVGDFAGTAAGMLMASVNGITPSSFLESARTHVSEIDLIKGLIKTLWFGLMISVVACHQGLKTTGGATGVGRSTTRSVVLCVVLIFISDFFLAQMLKGASIVVK